MNEHPYKSEHLQDYTGILTHNDTRGSLKMELKVEDNPVLERSVEKIESSIELEFRYNLGTSTPFFHDIHRCPKRRQDEQCPECKDIIDRYNQFEANLYNLQIGDTFRIKAALINNKQSVLPREIQSFKNYEPLTAACEEYWLRLLDTPEGINKKQELQDQRLQQEQDEKVSREKAEKDAKRRKRKERFQHFLGERPYTVQIIISTIGGIFGGIILATIFEPIPLLFRYIFYRFF